MLRSWGEAAIAPGGEDQEIRAWLGSAATTYTYTRSLVGIEMAENDRWMVVNRLEGNFPGAVVDLRYCFVIRDDLIAELVVAP
jgi:hypothetical protein